MKGFAVLGGFAWLFAIGLGLWWFARHLPAVEFAGCYAGGQLAYWFLEGFAQGLREPRERQ